MESDWKKFRAMVPMLRERYLATRNRELAAMLTDSAKNDTERFWDAMDIMKKEAKVLCECLDSHSRSKMCLHLLAMLQAGMMTKQDLVPFSDELQSRLARDLEKNEPPA